MILYEHPFASYCWKVLIALYERDVPFEPRLVMDAADRERLAGLWPVASIPVLVDGDAVLPESTAIIEHADGHGAAPPLVSSAKARLWDRVLDGQVMTPMQKIVADRLRPEHARDPYGLDEARATLDRAYALLDDRIVDEWLAGPEFSVAECAAAPSLFYARVVHRWDEAALPRLTAYFERLGARASVARVIEEARPYRELFPLPWPEYVS
jgi:glutathione S-transferase